ncbi:MAG TPA: RluA family pseudouridine synthase [Candidatus Koribacter sp.]|jgi:23S rRNA pseudouridine1911/1915/1917 synthase
MSQNSQTFIVTPDDAALRLDHYLVAHLPDVSRARVQALIDDEKILVNGKASKPSYKLRGDETIEVLGDYQPPPLRAIAEDIPLDVVYEDDDLAVINKPAGMMVHAGAGSTEEARNRGTLVNALLHRFRALSDVGGEMRPGIVHRLDKETSGLIVVAKNDVAHRKLAEQFSSRKVHKKYIALVHGWPKKAKGTINLPIARDVSRRTRMTTRGSGGRDALSHYMVLEKVESPYGKFALLEVKIETGRTHQIRVHLASLGHPVVGDTLYGAPGELRVVKPVKGIASKIASLDRNFLHAASIHLQQPRSGTELRFERPIPVELENFLAKLREPAPRSD